MPSDFLTIGDLYSRVGQTRIDSYFDDSYNGSLTEENDQVVEVLRTAEGLAYSRLMRAWPGNPADIGSGVRVLIENDTMLKVMISWIAVELAAERKTEFVDAQGNGPYKAMYDRALGYLDNLAKGLVSSPGQAVAGQNQQSGGYVTPEYAGVGTTFVFAASRDRPGGPGGF